MNKTLLTHASANVMYADAQRQYEEDVRACYTVWTEARDVALLLLKARLKMTDAYADSFRDDEAAELEADAYAEKWGGEDVRPPGPEFITKDNMCDPEPFTAYELREYLHDKASDKRDNALAAFEYTVQKIRG